MAYVWLFVCIVLTTYLSVTGTKALILTINAFKTKDTAIADKVITYCSRTIFIGAIVLIILYYKVW